VNKQRNVICIMVSPLCFCVR